MGAVEDKTISASLSLEHSTGGEEEEAAVSVEPVIVGNNSDTNTDNITDTNTDTILSVHDLLTSPMLECMCWVSCSLSLNVVNSCHF